MQTLTEHDYDNSNNNNNDNDNNNNESGWANNHKSYVGLVPRHGHLFHLRSQFISSCVLCFSTLVIPTYLAVFIAGMKITSGLERVF
jgi:hypothetical protein